MNEASIFPNLISRDQREAIGILFVDMEILPVSCLFFRCDEFCTVSKGRELPDDWLYIPAKGRLRCTVGDETREISRGELMMVPANTRHYFTMAPGTDYYEVFSLHLHAIDSTGHRLFERFESAFGRIASVESRFEELAVCTHLMGVSDASYVAFFCQLVRSILYEQVKGERRLRDLPEILDPRVSRVIGQVRSSCAEDWSVSAMARRSHLSVSRFREVFSQCTGESPKKFVQKVRLTHARSLLATEPHLSVEEVTDRVGFSDPRHFYKIYKNMFGETPRQSKI